MRVLAYSFINYWGRLPAFRISREYLKWVCLFILFCLVAMMTFNIASAAGYGGLISEKLLQRSGTGNSFLIIGRSGVQSSDLDMSMGAIVSTLPAGNIGTKTATLNGDLSDLNGMPLALVYFEWGYDGVYSYATSQQTQSVVGGFSAVISNFDVSKAINFRAVALTDGSYYASGQSFKVGTFSVAKSLLGIIIPLVLVMALVVTLVKMGMDWRVLITGVVAVILAYLVTKAILGL